MEAMIFAAGIGSRLKEYTRHRPKALLTIEGVTLLEVIVRKLISQGFRHIVINVHHYSELVIDYIQQKSFPADIFISDESLHLLDTGGGLLHARPYFSGNKDILIHNVDILSDIDLKYLYEYHAQTRSLATLAVSKRNTSRYLLFDDSCILKGWENIQTKEKKWCGSISNRVHPYAFSGIHVVSPAIFESLPQDKVSFSIIDAYLEIAQKNVIKGFLHQPNDWVDVGKPESLAAAKQFIQAQNFR